MAYDRYTLRREDVGTWAVIDIFTDLPAVVHKQVMILMDLEEAEEMVDLMNALDRTRRAVQSRS